MRQNKAFVNKIKLVLLAGTLSTLGFLVSCGGSTNNDQGTSITLTGFRNACEDSSDGNVVPNLSGTSVPLVPADDLEPDATDGGGDNFSTGGGVLIGLVLNNNLSKQFVRAQRAYITYYIPGATAQPPSTSVPISSFLEAAGGGASATPSTDSSSTTSGSSSACAEFFIVPPEIRQWLLLNRSYIPELPVSMETTVYVTLLSQAGDRFDTNESTILVQLTPDNNIAPGGATPTPVVSDSNGDGSSSASDSSGSGSSGADSGSGAETDSGDTGSTDSNL